MFLCFPGLEVVSQCIPCSPGKFCSGSGNTQPTGNCSARYYCAINATTDSPTDGSTGNRCPIGHYCPAGTAQPIPCEPGTYTDTLQNEVCLPCTPGRFCVTGTNPEPCPMGYYCPEGTGHIWQSCPAGTFSAATGLANVTQCTQCLGGFYCETTNQTTTSGPCDPGYFCRIGSDSKTPTGTTAGDAGVCPVGHYCPTQTDNPVACPAGTFNNKTSVQDLAGCQYCLDGYYCDRPGLEYPTGFCEPGFYCSGGSNTSRPEVDTLTGGPCPPGTYCPLGSSLPKSCAAGTYNPLTQQANCSQCPSGYYCETGANNITDCPKGIVTIVICLPFRIMFLLLETHCHILWFINRMFYLW